MATLTSDELNKLIAVKSNGQILLSFSCGKDSVAAWLELRKHFSSIVPIYLYLVPELEFVNRSLDYYEKFFDTKIIRLPHPSLYRWLTKYTFQAPENLKALETLSLPTFSYDDVFRVAKEDIGIPLGSYTAIGVRQNDSLNRRASISRYGAFNETRKTFFPIYDWNKAKLVDELRKANVKLPIDYKLWGRSFDGIDLRFLKPLKEYFPDDYRKVLEFFPLADIEFAREEYRNQYYARHGIIS